MPSGWFAPFRDGEHAQVVVGVGGGEQDFVDLCRTGAVAIPSGDDIAFLVGAGGDGGVTFGYLPFRMMRVEVMRSSFA